MPDEREPWTGRAMFEFFEHEAERGRGWPRLSRNGKARWDHLAELVVPKSTREAAEAQLLECEEALRSTQEQFATFRERMLEPIKGTEGRDIESMPWGDLLGVAVRNLNDALDAHRRVEAAEAEVERLREALRKIAEAKRENPAPGYEHTPLVGAEMRKIARAALSPREASER